jgi:hypothetical protein
MDDETWVIRDGSDKGKGQYLWGMYPPDRGFGGALGGGPPPGWWGNRAGAERYRSRPHAVRDAAKVHGRVVRLLTGSKP